MGTWKLNLSNVDHGTPLAYPLLVKYYSYLSYFCSWETPTFSNVLASATYRRRYHRDPPCALRGFEAHCKGPCVSFYASVHAGLRFGGMCNHGMCEGREIVKLW
jgi:hypothetical protein